MLEGGTLSDHEDRINREFVRIRRSSCGDPRRPGVRSRIGDCDLFLLGFVRR